MTEHESTGSLFERPRVTVERSASGLSVTVVEFEILVAPQLDDVTAGLLRAVVTAWGIQGETGSFEPESFDLPTFVDQGTSLLRWVTVTELFGDASLNALKGWIQRALYVGSVYSHQEMAATVRVSV